MGCQCSGVWVKGFRARQVRTRLPEIVAERREPYAWRVAHFFWALSWSCRCCFDNRGSFRRRDVAASISADHDSLRWGCILETCACQ